MPYSETTIWISFLTVLAHGLLILSYNTIHDTRYSFPKDLWFNWPDRKMAHSTSAYGMPMVQILWSCKRNTHLVCNQNLLKQIPCILQWNDIEWNRVLTFWNIPLGKKIPTLFLRFLPAMDGKRARERDRENESFFFVL